MNAFKHVRYFALLASNKINDFKPVAKRYSSAHRKFLPRISDLDSNFENSYDTNSTFKIT